jgi:adenine specific DNA methylase Mod
VFLIKFGTFEESQWLPWKHKYEKFYKLKAPSILTLIPCTYLKYWENYEEFSILGGFSVKLYDIVLS